MNGRPFKVMAVSTNNGKLRRVTTLGFLVCSERNDFDEIYEIAHSKLQVVKRSEVYEASSQRFAAGRTYTKPLVSVYP